VRPTLFVHTYIVSSFSKMSCMCTFVSIVAAASASSVGFDNAISLLQVQTSKHEEDQPPDFTGVEDYPLPPNYVNDWSDLAMGTDHESKKVYAPDVNDCNGGNTKFSIGMFMPANFMTERRLGEHVSTIEECFAAVDADDQCQALINPTDQEEKHTIALSFNPRFAGLGFMDACKCAQFEHVEAVAYPIMKQVGTVAWTCILTRSDSDGGDNDGGDNDGGDKATCKAAKIAKRQKLQDLKELRDDRATLKDQLKSATGEAAKALKKQRKALKQPLKDAKAAYKTAAEAKESSC